MLQQRAFTLEYQYWLHGVMDCVTCNLDDIKEMEVSVFGKPIEDYLREEWVSYFKYPSSNTYGLVGLYLGQIPRSWGEHSPSRAYLSLPGISDTNAKEVAEFARQTRKANVKLQLLIVHFKALCAMYEMDSNVVYDYLQNTRINELCLLLGSVEEPGWNTFYVNALCQAHGIDAEIMNKVSIIMERILYGFNGEQATRRARIPTVNLSIPKHVDSDEETSNVE